MYTFKEFTELKSNNALLTRFTGATDDLANLFSMPVSIVGLHTTLKHDISHAEQNIKNITPRLVLTFSAFNMDANALTAEQARTIFDTYDKAGKYASLVLPYRRMPMTCSFNADFVFGDMDTAVAMLEYISVLAMDTVLLAGDTYTKTTLIMDENGTIENDVTKGDITVKLNLKLNMQIIEPMSIYSSDKSGDLLRNVGQLQDDGTFNETALPENADLDANGLPIDKTSYSDNAGYRLRQNTSVVSDSDYNTITRPNRSIS